MNFPDKIRSFFGGLSDQEKTEYFNDLNSKILQLQQKVDFLHNKYWGEIHQELQETEDALTENLLLCKDPHETFSLRGQVLGLRQLQRILQSYEAELQESQMTLEQLRQEQSER